MRNDAAARVGAVAADVAALGLAPHSGWAVVVVLGGARADPRVLARARVELADPRDREARQPYHAVEELPVDEAASRIDAWMAIAQRMAYAQIQRLTGDLAASGHRMASVGILESSGRKGSSLAAILASHALIHTADGDHSRKALAAAAERAGLPVTRVRARDLEARAVTHLHRPAPRLQEDIRALGRQVGPPWGADQKLAALLAWLLL